MNAKNAVYNQDIEHFSSDHDVNADDITDKEFEKRREICNLDDMRKLECEKKCMCKGLHVSSDKLKPCHVEYFRDRINREKTMNQLGFCGLMDESENDFNAFMDISEQKYQDYALQANTKEVVCFNDRNRDAKI